MLHSHFMADSQLVLADHQAVTTTAISENVLDLGAQLALGAKPGAARGFGIPVGQTVAAPRFEMRARIPVLLQVTTLFGVASGTPTLTATLESADNAALSTNPVVHWTSGAVALADLVAGYLFDLDFLPEASYSRYLGFRFTASAAFNAGKIWGELGRASSPLDRGVM